MATRLSRGVDRLRKPEYTGVNRCVPCTVVNLLLAGMLAVTASTLGVLAGAPVAGATAGVVLFFLSATAIYLRGYLVPGTPRLTKTYFPDRMLRHFDDHPASDGPDDDVETTLVEAGAVAECEREDDLCLEDGFRAEWRDRIADVRASETSREDLATILDVDPDRLSFDEHGDSVVARLDSHRVGQWASQAALFADVAAERVLRSRYDGWTARPVRHRSEALSGLRVFLDRCPGCDGAVSTDTEVVESCCRSIDVLTVSCEDCGARLFEAEAPPE